MATLRVVMPFTWTHKGVVEDFWAERLVDSDHPAVKSHPAGWFEPVEVTASRQTGAKQPVVEQATAAPGEKRSVATKTTKSK